jgi:hypothetical protein
MIAAPHIVGKRRCSGVLPGVPRRSLTTLIPVHPSATQRLAQYLTPWLRWTIALSAVLSVVPPPCNMDARLA